MGDFFMYESFISDLNIFSNEFSSFIDTSDRPAILYKIQQKHIGELEDDLNIEDKKIDLYICRLSHALKTHPDILAR